MYERLAELMEEKRITAYRLSQETGITQATLSRWKSGKNSPSSETLKILAKYFHVSTDYLLGNVSEPYFYLDNERIINDINSYEDKDEDEKEKDENLIILNRAAKKMTPEQRKKLLDMAKVMFEEEFDD